jgi:hypothetical protein
MKDKRVLKWCGAALTFVLLLVWQHALLLESYASSFRKDNATPGADAIILLSSPNFLRLKHSLELGLDGFAPAIYVTTTPKPQVFEDLKLKYPTKMEWVTAVANYMKVDTVVAALPTLGDGVRSTFDEAYDALAWSKEHNYSRIIIVTNAFHSRRAHYAFEKVFNESGVQVEIGAAPDPGFSQSNWWRVDSGLAAYLTEPLKFMAYLVFDHSPKFIINR